jgi:hypothetical protein
MNPVTMKKIQYSALAALLYYIISNPITYSVVDSLVTALVGPNTLFKVAEAGCPTGYGLLVHSFVFFLVVLALMYA